MRNPYFTAKIGNFSQTTVVLGQIAKIQRHRFTAKIWNYPQTTVVLGQKGKMQSHHIADPQNPQPVGFCQIPILLLKYETFRKRR